MRWLKRSADFAGICAIHVEARATNSTPSLFTDRLAITRSVYGREAAVRMSRTLRSVRWSELDLNDAKLTSRRKLWAS